MVARIKIGLHEKGLLVYDAFKAFNSSLSGLLSCSELYGALEFLGIHVEPPQVYFLMKKIAIVNEGVASYDDFKRVFHAGDDEFETAAIGATGESNIEVIPPKPIKELVDLTARVDEDAKPVQLTTNILRFF